MDELGIILNFKERMITIYEIDLPMQSINDMPTSRKEALALNHSLLANLMEPKSTKEATNRVVQILDANNKKADLQAVVKDNCTHLSANKQKKLLELLTEFELLFDGTLGAWNTMPVSFQLKEGAHHTMAGRSQFRRSIKRPF
jgi:hypothetical protein